MQSAVMGMERKRIKEQGFKAHLFLANIQINIAPKQQIGVGLQRKSWDNTFRSFSLFQVFFYFIQRYFSWAFCFRRNSISNMSSTLSINTSLTFLLLIMSSTEKERGSLASSEDFASFSICYNLLLSIKLIINIFVLLMMKKGQPHKEGYTSLADQALEKSLKHRSEVSLSAFSFMFSEIVQQFMKNEKASDGPHSDLEQQLFELGLPVGERVLELIFYREKLGSNGAAGSGKREIKLVNMLHLINNQVWRTLFGRPADGLEQSIEDEDEYRILDKQPITNKYTSMGKGAHMNCSSYIAGIIEGMLNSAKMYARVTAHLYHEEESVASADDQSSTTIYVIKFAKEVTARERAQ